MQRQYYTLLQIFIIWLQVAIKGMFLASAWAVFITVDICWYFTGSYIRRVFNISLGGLIAYLSIPVVQNLLSPRQAMNTSFDPLRIVNTYGAFGRWVYQWQALSVISWYMAWVWSFILWVIIYKYLMLFLKAK